MIASPGCIARAVAIVRRRETWPHGPDSQDSIVGISAPSAIIAWIMFA